MDTIFINSKNSGISDTHRLLLNLTNKIDLKKIINMLLYQILAFTTNGKIQKSHTNIMNLKYHLWHGMNNLNYLMDHVLYQIFKIILTFFIFILKNMEKRLIILQ